ncbi:MAG: M23 family metallopeptidase [Chloroflexi bacterium]|nr:M23 family metallopeptidase [Chloroflexota bacterium]
MWAIAVLLALAACGQTTAAPAATPTDAVTRAATATTRAATVTADNPATPTASPTAAPASCATGHEILDGHFLLLPPIGPEGNQALDPSYRYGSTGGGQFDVHHGVELVNRGGTPVLAAADGVVVFAGPDDETLISAWTDFYGNVVVLRHELPGQPAPVFTVYGHLSEIGVTAGAQVRAGDEIGRVGATGVALGNHLHFEVRQGAGAYEDTRNPELWLAPAEGAGALAVVVHAPPGAALAGLPVVVAPLDDPAAKRIYLEGYGTGANSDDAWGELAAAALPAGRYTVAFTLVKPYRLEVEVQAGRLTLATFCLGD